MRGELVEAAVEAEWANVLRTVRAGMLAVPARLPHLTAHDVADAEIRAALGGGDEPSFRCRSCGTRRYKPPVRMIKLTEQREFTPYKMGSS